MTQRLNCYNLIPKLREHPGWGLDKGVLLDASAVKALFKERHRQTNPKHNARSKSKNRQRSGDQRMVTNRYTPQYEKRESRTKLITGNRKRRNKRLGREQAATQCNIKTRGYKYTKQSEWVTRSSRE